MPDWAPSESLEILDFQGECLVVNKPGGVLTQAPPGIESMESRVRRYFRQCSDTPIDQPVYVGMPHRLDRPASGVMLMGQSKKTTRKLALQFEKRTVRKTYWALVEGCPEVGSWTDWMRKMSDHAASQICQEQDEGAQLAKLDARVLETDGRITLLEMELHTGRTHQIRLQTSHRGSPILGDSQYGATLPFGPATLDQRQRWIALHARCLDFWHPQLHQPLVVEAPLSEHWLQLETGIDLRRWDQQRLDREPGGH